MLLISLIPTYWPISGNRASQLMSVRLRYLCLAHRRHPDQAHLWMAAGRKQLTHPLLSLIRTRTFTPDPFSIKKAWILTQGRWVFGTVVPHLLSLLAFWIKSLFLVPTAGLLTYWPVTRRAVQQEVGKTHHYSSNQVNPKFRQGLHYSLCTNLYESLFSFAVG